VDIAIEGSDFDEAAFIGVVLILAYRFFRWNLVYGHIGGRVIPARSWEVCPELVVAALTMP
jgi:hypothetical protein